MTDLPPETDTSATSVADVSIEAPPPGPSFLQALGVVVLWQLTASACAGVLRVLFADTPDVGAFFTSTACWYIGSMVAWLLLFHVLIRKSGGSWRLFFPLRRVRARAIAFTVAGNLAIVFGFLALAYLLRVHDFIKTPVEPDLVRPAAVALAIAGVIGPICEEFFFRGWMLLGFLNRYSPARATMLSSLLFALSHVYPLLMVITFSAGCFFAWMARRTGSLIPTIAAHIVGNTAFVIIHIAMGQ
jgi:membrane protease YdiL (CAAX protease family)